MAHTRMLLLAGGQSEEHEVSLVSARAVHKAAREAGFACAVRVITRSGEVLGGDDSEAAIAAGKVTTRGKSLSTLIDAIDEVDVVFPLIHGPLGEDGTLQGLLTLANKPFVGSGTLASATCMDKPTMKHVLYAAGIPQTNYATLTHGTWQRKAAEEMERVTKTLKAPWFIKPANLGSSVGITRATDQATLKKGIEEAFTFDVRVIVEEGVSDIRELEVAVLGNEAPETSTVGEITYQAEFYDYDAKYNDARSKALIPAPIPEEVAAEIARLAKHAFVLLDCAGFARIDFFYQQKSGKVLLNELNTLPGFTPISMFPQMWAHAGVDYVTLVKKLVELALERHKQQRRARTARS